MKIVSTGNHSSIGYDGEEYLPDAEGVFTVPAAAGRELIAAHGFQEFVPVVKKEPPAAEEHDDEDNESLAETEDGSPDFDRMRRKELQAYLKGEKVAFDRSAGVDELRSVARSHHESKED